MGHDWLPFKPLFKPWESKRLGYSQDSFKILSNPVCTLSLKLSRALLNAHPIFYVVCSTDTYLRKKCKCSNKLRSCSLIS